MITDTELEALDVDSRRSKNAPDRRRRRTIKAVERIRKVDQLIADFAGLMNDADRLPGSIDMRVGSQAVRFADLYERVLQYKEEVMG